MSEFLAAIDARLVGSAATGDATYWTGLLHGLAQIQPEARILLLSNAPQPAGIPQTPFFTWETVPASSSRLWSLVRFPMRARKARARAIHTQYNLSPLVGKRGVTTVHDVSFFVQPAWFRPRDRFVLQRGVPSSVRRAARVITVSEASRRDLERYIPAAVGKSRVTLLARSPLVQPMPRARAQDHVQRQLGQAEPFLLTVGTRWPRKNMSLAIEACSRLRPEIPHALLVTGKPGWGEEPAHSRARATGYVDDVTLSALYCAADLFLVPSHYEGFGLTLLEAFACGCPVLSSNGGSLPEVAGGAAEMLPPEGPDQWAAGIESLLGDSSKLGRLREAGLQRERAFSWEETARRTLEVYREVAE